jgi:hypothetical protein
MAAIRGGLGRENMYYKGAMLARMASKMKREALRLPGIRVLHGYSHREALEAHLTRLPPIDPRDLPTLEQMRRTGVQVVSVDSLDLPESPAMFAAAETLAAELRAVKVNGDNAPRIPYARLMELPEIYAWGLSERLLSVAENYIGLPVRYHGADVRREVADGQPNDVRLFHIDTEDHRMVRVIVYLNDVHPGGGPFEYVTREQTIAAAKKLHYGSGFVPDPRLAQVLPRAEWRLATGSAHTAAFADTCRVFHRAQAPTTVDRYSVTYTWTSTTPVKEYPTMRIPDKAYDFVMGRATERQRAALPPRD